MQLRARDGRALLAGEVSDAGRGLEAGDHGAAGVLREVDPHSLALGADLADALHEWARVADAVHRNGQDGGSAAARLISRRGQQLASRIAAVMGRPVSYADPLTGEVTEVDVPEPVAEQQPDRGQRSSWWSRSGQNGGARQRGATPSRATPSVDPRGDDTHSDDTHGDDTASGQSGGRHSRSGRHGAAEEPPPWNTGLTVSFVTAVLMMIVVITLSLALGAANRWLPLIANVVIAVGLAPSVWLARHALVWRWVAFGVVGGIVVAWVALLFTAL